MWDTIKTNSSFGVLDPVVRGRMSGQTATSHVDPATFKLERIVELCTLRPGSDNSVWNRLQPTGDLSVLMASGPYTAGFLIGTDPVTGRWRFFISQDAYDPAYVMDVAAASQEASTFETRLLWNSGKTGYPLSWAVFRFPDGVVKASPILGNPAPDVAVDGHLLRVAQLYPEDYVLKAAQWEVLPPAR